MLSLSGHMLVLQFDFVPREWRTDRSRFETFASKTTFAQHGWTRGLFGKRSVTC